MKNELLNDYELVELYKLTEWEESFVERYVDLYDKYDYIVGDVSATKVRLTGFYSESFDSEFSYFKGARMAYDAGYYILKKKGA